MVKGVELYLEDPLPLPTEHLRSTFAFLCQGEQRRCGLPFDDGTAHTTRARVEDLRKPNRFPAPSARVACSARGGWAR